jgi:hypothetical protein
MRLDALSGIVAFAGTALSSGAQPCNPANEIHAAAQNSSFSEGLLGNAPPDGFLVPNGSCRHTPQCMKRRSHRAPRTTAANNARPCIRLATVLQSGLVFCTRWSMRRSIVV